MYHFMHGEWSEIHVYTHTELTCTTVAALCISSICTGTNQYTISDVWRTYTDIDKLGQKKKKDCVTLHSHYHDRMVLETVICYRTL